MYARILKNPLKKRSSFFLFGARGTGKTSWLKENFDSKNIIDLLDNEVFYRLEAKPGDIKKYIGDSRDWVIIDEVQKIPDLLNEIHRLIESKRLKFILTGSSARKLKRKGANLLAGRALLYKMYPLTIEELGSDFQLEKALKFGLLPEVYDKHLNDPQKYLDSYVKVYLREEIQQEGLSRNLGAFSRFLEAASFSQGSILNMSEVSREAQIKQKTVSAYFDLLEDMLLSYRIPCFNKKAKRRLITHPKFYFFDAGIFQTIRPKGILDTASDIEGPALETLVLQELIAINDYYELGYKIYFWRTANGQEVDFILYGEKGFFAIEVKKSKTIRREDLSGLKSFKRDYPEAKGLIFYGGKKEEHHGELTALPIEEGLKNLKTLLINHAHN